VLSLFGDVANGLAMAPTAVHTARYFADRAGPAEMNVPEIILLQSVKTYKYAEISLKFVMIM